MAVHTKRQKDQKYDHIKKLYDDKKDEVIIKEEETNEVTEDKFVVEKNYYSQNKVGFWISLTLILVIGASGYLISISI